MQEWLQRGTGSGAQLGILIAGSDGEHTNQIGYRTMRPAGAPVLIRASQQLDEEGALGLVVESR